MKRSDLHIFSLSQDIFVSLIASLVSILVIRWISDPIPGYTVIVFKWLLAAAVGTVPGILISRCSRDVKKYATVRSIARVIAAILIKEAVLVAALLVGFVHLPLSAYYLLSFWLFF
jgi:hypothetical protein